MNRTQAATAGQRFYDSLKPCKRCADNAAPTTLRYTSNSGCVKCQKSLSAIKYQQIRALIAAAKQA